MSYRLVFQQNLNRALERAGKTQADIAHDLELRESTVSDWFTGKKMPRAESQEKLAEYLGVTVSWLSGGEELPVQSNDPASDLNVRERLLVETYRVLPEAQKARLETYIKLLTMQSAEEAQK